MFCLIFFLGKVVLVTELTARLYIYRSLNIINLNVLRVTVSGSSYSFRQQINTDTRVSCLFYLGCCEMIV